MLTAKIIEEKIQDETTPVKKLLPELDAGDRDLSRSTGAALKVLTDANEPPFMFRHADFISRIQRADDGCLVLRRLTKDSLRYELARAAHFFILKKKQYFDELPPRHLVDNILSEPNPPFPVVTRIIHAPIFAPDGTIITNPGYAPVAQLFYDPPADLNVVTDFTERTHPISTKGPTRFQ